MNKRIGLALRVFTRNRRNQIKESDIESYHTTMLNVEEKYKTYLYNMDETAWYMFMSSGRTLAEKGAAEVQIDIEENVKKNFTAIATVCVTGEKLPLILVASGATNVCHKQFNQGGRMTGRSPPVQTDILHSKSGWTDEGVMLQYLEWLRKSTHQSTHQPIGLILDNFGAHCTDAVLARATELCIELIFLPANGTGEFQPLDRKVFGPLKKKGGKLWLEWHENHEDASFATYDSACLLLQSWREISKETVLSGWNWNKPALFRELSEILEDDGDHSPLYTNETKKRGKKSTEAAVTTV